MNEDPRAAQLHDASRRLVVAQTAWDSILLKNEAGCLVPQDALCSTRKAVSGERLIRLVLPFYEEALDSEAGSCGQVPLDRTLGSSCSWGPEQVAEAKRDALQARFVHPDRANAHDEHAAVVTRVDPFGLYVSHEGKNRVAFLRYRGVQTMPAHVSVKRYLDPVRIQTYCVQLLGREEVWAVLDSRWVQPLHFPQVTATLLEPLGINGAAAWPSDWPDPVWVATEIVKARQYGRKHGRADLHRLQAKMQREEFDDEMTFGSVHELEGVRIRLAVILGGPGLMLGALAWNAFQLPGGEEAVSWVVALLIANLVLLITPILRARRGAFASNRTNPKQRFVERHDSLPGSVAEQNMPANSKEDRD